MTSTAESSTPVLPAPGAASAADGAVNTRFILFLAALLIVNSHLEPYYPTPYLAGDGLLGFSLFFFVSGIGLALSSRHGMRSFPQYYWRRIKRIYPTLLIMKLGPVLVSGEIATMRPLEFVAKFVWPTENTFVGPLMVSYIVLYPLLRWGSARSILATIFLLMLPHLPLALLADASGPALNFSPQGLWISRVANFQILLLGAYLALNLPRIRRDRFWLDLIAVAALFCAFVVVKVIHVKAHAVWPFVVLFAMAAGISFFLFRIAASTGLATLLSRAQWMTLVISLIGACTLEIYFIQEVLVPWPRLQQIRFPMNIICLWLLLIPAAFVLERFVAFLRSGCSKFDLRIPRGGM